MRREIVLNTIVDSSTVTILYAKTIYKFIYQEQFQGKKYEKVEKIFRVACFVL